MLDEGHATASPDSLTSVTGSVLHLWREWGALPDLPVLMMISGQMSWSTQCCLWAHVPLKDTRAPCQPHEVGFWWFGPICAWVACWRSLCIVSLLFLFVFTQRSRYQSCCWVDVLVSFPHSSECTGKHQKHLLITAHIDLPLLAQLDGLWDLIGLRLSHATSSGKNRQKAA